MAKEVEYGGGSESLNDLISRAQRAAQAESQLRDRQRERIDVEERGVTADEEQNVVRTDTTSITDRLTQAIARNESALAQETAAINANTSAWRANAEARAQAEGGVAAGGARGGGGTRVVATALPEEDPAARGRYESATRAQAAAEAERSRAGRAYTTAIRPTSGASTEEQTALLQARQEAQTQVQVARQQVAAAQRDLQAQDQLAALKAQAVAEQQRINQELTAQRESESRVVSGMAESQGSLRLSVLGTPRASEGARNLLSTGGLGAAESLQRPWYQRHLGTQLPGMGGGSLALPQVAGASSAAGDTAQVAAETDLNKQMTEHAQLLQLLGQRQQEYGEKINQANAQYAEYGNVLQRNGALTTEFLQAFANGDVTLQEFGEQMVSTIGKFSGWAVAGAAVYGIFDALKQVTAGASETESAVSQLGRFIPGLGGPAGGGRGQTTAAMNTVRDISTQFNVPISEVTSAMQVMARTFHNVSDAGQATRAVLAAVRLDQVPEGQATQYLTSISQSLGISSGGGLVGIIDSLNSLQSQYGARVSQTLPGIVRGAPAAIAGGLPVNSLEAMTAMAVRSGQTGNQFGTALTRSITNFAFSSGSDVGFRRYGITPQFGNYGGLMNQVMATIDEREKKGTLTGRDLSNLAGYLGGPSLGGRAFLPLLAQEAEHPGAYQQYIQTAGHPRPYQEDLGAVLDTVKERFESIGIALQNFGSRLAQIGAFTPLLAGLDVMRDFVNIIERLSNPLVQVAALFNQLPGPVRDLLSVLVLARASRALYNTTFGSNVQGFIGNLPGLAAIDREPRAAIRSTVSRLRTSTVPTQEREVGNLQLRASRRGVELQSAMDAESAAAQEVARVQQRYGAESEEAANAAAKAAEAESDVLDAIKRFDAAESDAADGAAALARTQADITQLTSRAYTTQQKINYMLERQLVATEEQVDIQAAANADAKAIMTGGARGGGGTVGAAAGGAKGAMSTAEVEPIVATTAAVMASSGGIAQDLALAQENIKNAMPGGETPVSAGGLEPAGLGAVSMAAMRQPTAAETEASEASGAESMGMMERIRAGAASGLGTVRDAATSGLNAARGVSAEDVFSGPGMMAGLLATQFGGSLIGQNRIGQYVSNVGGEAVTGGLIASMIGKGGPAGIAAGTAIGTVAGSFQQGGVRQGLFSVGGLGVGGLIGAGIGSLTDEVTGPFGTMAGAAVGSQVGSLIGTLTGSSQTPSQAAQAQANKFAALATSGTQTESQLQGDFLSQLQSAYSGSGSTQSKAQTTVSTTIQRLQAEYELYGAGTPEGKAAATQLQAVSGAALAQAPTDPTTSLQVLQAITSGRSTYLQNMLQAGITTGRPGTGLQTAQGTADQYGQLYDITYGKNITDANQQLASSKKFYEDTEATYAGKPMSAAAEANVKAAKSMYDDAYAAAQAAQAAEPQAKAAERLAQAQAIAQGYQADTTTATAAGTLAQAQAGGNTVQQLAAQAASQTNLVKLAAEYAKKAPGYQSAADLQDAQAALLQTHTQQAQQGLTELQGRQGVAYARVPIGNPIEQAKVQAQNYTADWQYMKDHAKDFDPSQIAQALAQSISAQQQYLNEIVQYNTQMDQLKTQTEQAGEFGDALAQALTQQAGAYQVLGLGGTPQQRAQAQANVAAANAAVYQAQQQRVQEQGQLNVAMAQETGDPVAAAQASVTLAENELAMAHGYDQQRQALTDLANANLQLRQSQEQYQQDLGALAASTTSNPLTQLTDQIKATQKALALAPAGSQEALGLQTQLNNYKLQYQSNYIELTQGTIQFQLDMQQITASQAITQLQALLKTKDITKQQQQSISEEIRSLELSDTTSGQFDIGPGNIPMPTVYDVRRAMGSAGFTQNIPQINALGQPNAAITNNNTINIEVHTDADVAKVGDVVGRATGGTLKASMRAAGVRGT